MSEKGINVKLLTRSSEQYSRELLEKGVLVAYYDSVHAKLIVVDRCVGIVSSMNMVASSSGGALWEAGIITLEEKTVISIASSILNKI